MLQLLEVHLDFNHPVCSLGRFPWKEAQAVGALPDPQEERARALRHDRHPRQGQQDQGGLPAVPNVQAEAVQRHHEALSAHGYLLRLPEGREHQGAMSKVWHGDRTQYQTLCRQLID